MELPNCHPFQREWLGRHWLFCHNGALRDFRPSLDGSHLPVGRTDSECAFCWLIQELRRRFRGAPAPHWPQLAPVLARLVAEIARHGVFNMLLGDGHALYAYGTTRLAWLQRQAPFGGRRLLDHDLEIDLDAVNGAGDRMALVATAPLTDDEPWQHFAPGELRVFVDGQSVWHDVAEGIGPRAREALTAAA